MTTTDSDLLALHAAILSEPDEDTVRLEYADRLDELDGSVPCGAVGRHHGDRCDGGRIQSPNAQFTQDCPTCRGTGSVPNGYADRAEFVRVQVELAHENEIPWRYSCTVRDPLRRREGELHAANWHSWWPREWDAIKPVYRRGFVEEIGCCSADWLAHHEQLFWSPKQTVACPVCNGQKKLKRCRGCGKVYRRIHKYSDCDNAACDGEEADSVPCHRCRGHGTVARPHVPTAQPIVSVIVSDGGMGRLGLTPRNNGREWFDNHHPIRWPGVEFTLPRQET